MARCPRKRVVQGSPYFEDEHQNPNSSRQLEHPVDHCNANSPRRKRLPTTPYCSAQVPVSNAPESPTKRLRPKLQSQYFSSPPDDDPNCGHSVNDIQDFCADSLTRCSYLSMRDVPTPTLYYVALLRELLEVKPSLIQEELRLNPWKLLIAVFFLNKTTGKLAIPIFRQIIERWPTPYLLSQASAEEIIPIITTLGLQHKRAQLLIKFSAQYFQSPPASDMLLPTKARLATVSDDFAGRILIRNEAYDAFAAIAHYPGVGAYALDSYRIFCGPECSDGWKTVRPADKELIRYLRWRWAFEAEMRWDPIYGVVGPAEPGYIISLIYYLKASSLH